MQKWKKIGRLYLNEDIENYLPGYAAVPFIEKKRKCIRIYFSSRNINNKSLIRWIEVANEDLFKITNVSKTPVLNLGRNGYFDHDGIMGCHITQVKQQKFLYYIGWNVGGSTPFRNSIGLAKWNEASNSFEKVSEGPIMDRSIYDKCFVASNCIIKIQDKYIMYYLSCSSWSYNEGIWKHEYNIKQAESYDGITWKLTGINIIPFKYPNEYAISSPRVLFENDRYKMWYSYRGGFKSDKYRIGYAESTNGLDWIRRDEEVLLDVSSDKNAWDSEMLCYPYVFDHQGKKYLLYNGNGYGQTGFGLAVLLNN